ncbi:MAG TPA: thioesterase family protein [Geobacterales bacterium]|nr:thioesterase family protein [Geobacterales bacterium]
MPFVLEFPVDWVDTDALGIVHFTNFFRYFERAETEMLKRLGIDYNEIFEKGYAIPRVEAFCKYYKPLRYGDQAKVLLRVSEIGDKHYKYSFEILNSKTNEKNAEGYVTIVFIDKAKFKAIQIPNFIREKLELIK